MDKEIWKPLKIDGTDNRYEISNYGRARSWCNCNNGKKHKPRILKPGFDKSTGYRKIAIWDNNTSKHKTVAIHRAVCEMFVDNPGNKNYVNHIDFDRQNNHYTNLEWVTAKENSAHSFDRFDNFYWLRRCGEDHGMSKLTDTAVKDIRHQAKTRGRYYGQKELANKYDVSKCTIKDVVSGRTWNHVT